ncbi:amidase [Nocardioides sp. Root1257]|uniref:amidase n=1 Tax=unclassified Nocardioides TaxID=2615069 RepID=UPI0006F4DEC5|nr:MULTISPECIES: amidase [unclassified Nocardioides]KQW53589.1 amidase [Nocardioides sp. Root1257]KRC56275.1 amidase [Nocardioides sp. Root224]
MIDVVEVSIADLGAALEAGETTSVELVAAYLNRIAAYDRAGIALNSVPVLNPSVFADAAASDARRARGEARGPLDGIPYTAKDSYQAEGLTVAAGSPAFADLVAQRDAFTIERLRAAGAVLVGLTNMPPMANGGMQRGVYGRAESPYNAAYLTSAFGSGSSNGSGTSTAASFAAFGLGEETWSSGRAPASNNALVAYTPSRGVISMRGNWPLVPTMDVVVPHTRTVDDLLAVLEVVVADDSETRGDFWRVQPWVELPAASEVRPTDYAGLRDGGALAGKRLGVPRMYIGADGGADRPIETADEVVALWSSARKQLEALGAEVVEVDFPVVSNYENDRPGTRSMVDRGLVPAEFAEHEIWDLSMLAWDDFLEANGDPALNHLADVDGPAIFPQPDGALLDQYGEHDFDVADYVTRARAGLLPLAEIPTIAEGLQGLEATRRLDFEDWLDDLGLDAVVFPAVADIGPADADVDPDSAALAWRNGTWVANGNLVVRHLGIPTVTVPMGTRADIGMPVGLTIAGRAYDDSNLLRYGYAFEQSSRLRTPPARTPRLATSAPTLRDGAPGDGPVSLSLTAVERDGAVHVEARTDRPADVAVFVAGVPVTNCAAVPLAPQPPHSQWRAPYGALVVALARTATGHTAGALCVSSGPL